MGRMVVCEEAIMDGDQRTEVSDQLSVQWIADSQTGNADEISVMGPDFCCAILKCDQGDLQIENPGPAHVQLRGYLEQPQTETRAGLPQPSGAIRQKVCHKRLGLVRPGRAAGTGGMGHNTPEFRKARQRYAPTSGAIDRLLNRFLGGGMLWNASPVCVHQQIGIKCDHDSECNQRLISARSVRLTAGGVPPS